MKHIFFIWGCRLLCFLFSLYFVACSNEEQGPPVVFTGEVMIITSDSVVVQGKIVANGLKISDHGFVWDNMTKTPTLEESFVISLGGMQSPVFSAVIESPLVEGRVYYVRAYAREGNLLVYGKEAMFISQGGKEAVITSFEPLMGTWGDTITIYGEHFSIRKEEQYLSIGNISPKILESTSDKIVAVISEGLKEIEAVVMLKPEGRAGVIAEQTFKLLPPVITGFSPPEATYLMEMEITGKHFMPWNTNVRIGDKTAYYIQTTPESIKFEIPTDLHEGENTISVTVLGQTTVAEKPFVFVKPSITSVNPLTGAWGDTITITGKFSKPRSTYFYINSREIRDVQVNGDTAVFIVPYYLEAIRSKISMRVGFNPEVVYPEDFVLIPPEIKSITPESGTYGQTIEIHGDNFSTSVFTNVYLGDMVIKPYFSSKELLRVRIPEQIQQAEFPIRVHFGKEMSITASQHFIMDMHTLEDYHPKVGMGGDKITFIGSNFNPYGYLNNIYIGDNRLKPKWESNVLEATLPFDIPEGNQPIRFELLGRELTAPFTLHQPWQRLRDLPFIFSDYYFQINYRYFAGKGSEFREYFPSSDTWTGRSAFPGNPLAVRYSTFTGAFKVYAVDGNTHYSYDPATNKWATLGSFPSLAQGDPPFYAFTVGTTGYIIGNPISLTVNGETIDGREVWRYLEDTNTWQQVASLPVNQNITPGISFTINNKGYVGVESGIGQIWQYDPVSNTWSMINPIRRDIPNFFRATISTTIVSDNKAFFITNDYWHQLILVYDPLINTLKFIGNIPANIGSGLFSFTLPDANAIIGSGDKSVYHFNPSKLPPDRLP